MYTLRVDSHLIRLSSYDKRNDLTDANGIFSEDRRWYAVEGIANKGGSSQTGLEVMIHGGTLEDFEQSKGSLFVHIEKNYCVGLLPPPPRPSSRPRVLVVSHHRHWAWQRVKSWSFVVGPPSPSLFAVAPRGRWLRGVVVVCFCVRIATTEVARVFEVSRGLVTKSGKPKAESPRMAKKENILRDPTTTESLILFTSVARRGLPPSVGSLAMQQKQRRTLVLGPRNG
ncbi:hypothetical protein PAXINDRAFT_159063 [Paxillus involutus ATCC 200175]|uniref:Uncharacterized protein n=1 Tax=Paxillus involutus ATCC 200175 TaxID=664439 RepID=A0A0C9T1I1_PAXIN|nr:hypothetical protein PAXINDRAFT_159063 [Paxillus involutus ATCC 200175]